MSYPTPTIGGISYFPLPEGWEPYRYDDEIRPVPLLGGNPLQPDRNEILQSSARGAEASTISALCEDEADADELVALWGTVTTHDDGTDAGARDVAVVAARKTPHSWGGSAPVWIVTLKTRTVIVEAVS